jgi:hypothetical protein
MAKVALPQPMDTSILAWLTNSYMTLRIPITIMSVTGLLVAGTFAEIAPRKSLEFLDNTLGSILFFIVPFIFATTLDWATGLLAAVVSLIIFARLQKEDLPEGFSDVTDQSTKLISNSHRWLVERVLGERPIAISSDRIATTSSKDENIRTSSSSSMNPSQAVTHQSAYTSMNLSPSHSSSSSNK